MRKLLILLLMANAVMGMENKCGICEYPLNNKGFQLQCCQKYMHIVCYSNTLDSVSKCFFCKGQQNHVHNIDGIKQDISTNDQLAGHEKVSLLIRLNIAALQNKVQEQKNIIGQFGQNINALSKKNNILRSVMPVFLIGGLSCMAAAGIWLYVKAK